MSGSIDSNKRSSRTRRWLFVVSVSIVAGTCAAWIGYCLLFTLVPPFGDPPLPKLARVIESILFLHSYSSWQGAFGCVIFWTPFLAVALASYSHLSSSFLWKASHQSVEAKWWVTSTALSILAGCTFGICFSLSAGHLMESNSTIALDPMALPLLWLDAFDRRLGISGAAGGVLALLLSSAPMIGMALHVYCRLQPKPQATTCAKCGYNLTGNVSGRCPECGHLVARPPGDSTARA